MNKWICSICGDKATSKCASTRTVYPSNQQATLMGYVYDHKVSVGPTGQYLSGGVEVTVSLEYHKVVDGPAAEAMREIELKYVSKPWCPRDTGPCKPSHPSYNNREKPGKPLTKREFMNLHGWHEDNEAPWRDYKVWCKTAKAAYEKDLLEYEESVRRFQSDMAEYEAKFIMWQHYEENYERVRDHNANARRLKKEFFLEHLDDLLGIDKDNVRSWLCNHDWVLDLEIPTPQPCSLGTCTHRTIGVSRK